MPVALLLCSAPARAQDMLPGAQRTADPTRQTKPTDADTLERAALDEREFTNADLPEPVRRVPPRAPARARSSDRRGVRPVRARAACAARGNSARYARHAAPRRPADPPAVGQTDLDARTRRAAGRGVDRTGARRQPGEERAQ